MTGPLWHPLAREDIAAIVAHVAARNPDAALALTARIEAGAAALGEMPGMGRPGRVDGTRELVLHPNYVVVYAAADGAVTVLRVLHAARQWP